MKLTKALSVLLAVCLVLTCLPITARANEVVEKGFLDNIVWEMHDDGTLYIYGSGDMPEYRTPWDAYQNDIKTVVIEEGVTSVGPSSFDYYKSLTRVIIGGAATIGKSAFDHCTNLASIELFPGVQVIGSDAFAYCAALPSVTIPGTVTTIGEHAFTGCSSLETVTLSQGLTTIADYAFFSCKALTGITLPAGLVSLGEYAFYACSAMTEVSIPSTLATVSEFAFGSCEKLTKVSLAEGVRTIGNNAFNACTGLTDIVLPDTLTTIENSAFSGCYALPYIEIPAGVTSIGDKAFSPCSSLKSMAFFGDAPTFAGDEIFRYTTITISYPRNNPTWTADVRKNYGGNLTWIAGCPDSHSFGGWEVYRQASCYSDGEERRYCAGCDLFISRATAPAHDFVESIVAPTCTKDGYTYYNCRYCGMYEYGGPLPATGHSPKTVTEEPTCTRGGYTYVTCTTCGDTLSYDSVPAKGHDYDEEIFPATCTDDGYTVFTCKVCGAETIGDYVSAPGHDYESVVKEPTCTEGGYTTHTCKTCGYTYQSDYSSALRHDYEVESFDATCTEGGRTTYTCKRCGYSYDTNITFPLEHDYEVVVTEPDIGQEGYTTYTCTRCGDSYQSDFVDALIELHVLEGDYGQWLDQGSLVFRIDANAADFTDINVDGFELYSEEYTVTGNPAVITLNPVFFSRMGEGEHTLQIFFGNGLATAHFTVTRTPEPPEEESYIDWSFENGTLTITGRGNMENYYEAPWNEYKDQIKHVVIEDGITSISSVFQSYPNLTTVSIPDSVQYIEDHAFYECASLTSIVIPEGVPEIGMGTFCGCTSLESIYIPDSVQTLGYYAFMSCSSLKEVRIPEGVTYLDEMLFWACTSLTTVHLPSTLTEIRSSAFSACYSMTGINLPHGLTYIGSMVFSACSALSNVVIPNTVTYIGEQAFSACFALNTLTFHGDAPTFDGTRIFENSYATAYYPKNNPTWTAGVRQSYGAGYLAWVAVDPCEKGHSYRTEVTAPTCTEDGYTTYTCTVCGHSYVGDEITAPGHDYTVEVIEPTCTEGGSTTHTCSRCGDTYVDHADPLGHDYISQVTPPTFENQGCTTHTCSRCGDSYVTDIVPALIPYEILEGDDAYWTDEDQTDLVFRADGAFSDFTELRINGKTVDPSRYTVTEGSTVITLSAEYLLRLPSGEYILEIVFTDGYATAAFTVEKFHTLSGDVNGDDTIDTTDAYLIVLYYNERMELDDNQLAAADVNNDGSVDTTDAYYIVLFYNEKIDSFPT